MNNTVINGGTDGRYLSTGHLVYALRGTLLAVPFDPTSLSIMGGPVPLVEGVWEAAGGVSGFAQFAVSFDGTLAYVPLASVTTARRTLVWVDRQGREDAIAAPPRPYVYARFSPNGTRLALDILDDNRDIWVMDLSRGTLTRVTSDPTVDRQPVWTPDGQRLIFSSDRTGAPNLYWQAANGIETAERLTESNNSMYANTMSPDGRRLILHETASGGTPDLTILDIGDGRRVPSPPSGVRETKPLVQTPFVEYNAEISPAGRWLAYQSNHSGAFEVYVRPFPDVAGGQWQVSTAGGTEPLWARDGRELFYRAPKGAVMRVSIAPGSTWTAGTPAQLLEARSYALGDSGAFTGTKVFRTYDISPDGRRFLMIKNSETPAQISTGPRIVVVQNWFEDLKRLAPVN